MINEVYLQHRILAPKKEIPIGQYEVWGCGQEYKGNFGNWNPNTQTGPTRNLDHPVKLNFTADKIFTYNAGIIFQIGNDVYTFYMTQYVGLGNNWSSFSKNEPVKIFSGTNIKKIIAIYPQIFILDETNLYATGKNDRNHFGIGSKPTELFEFTVISTDVVDMSVNEYYGTVLLKNDGIYTSGSTVWGNSTSFTLRESSPEIISDIKEIDNNLNSNNIYFTSKASPKSLYAKGYNHDYRFTSASKSTNYQNQLLEVFPTANYEIINGPDSNGSSYGISIVNKDTNQFMSRGLDNKNWIVKEENCTKAYINMNEYFCIKNGDGYYKYPNKETTLVCPKTDLNGKSVLDLQGIFFSGDTPPIGFALVGELPPKLTITAPENSLVYINGELKNSIQVEKGTSVSYRVVTDFKQIKEGSVVVNEDTTLNIEPDDIEDISDWAAPKVGDVFWDTSEITQNNGVLSRNANGGSVYSVQYSNIITPFSILGKGIMNDLHATTNNQLSLFDGLYGSINYNNEKKEGFKLVYNTGTGTAELTFSNINVNNGDVVLYKVDVDPSSGTVQGKISINNGEWLDISGTTTMTQNANQVGIYLSKYTSAQVSQDIKYFRLIVNNEIVWSGA